MFKVYVGALYVEKPTSTPRTSSSPSRSSGWTSTCCATSRKDKIVEAIREGFEKQSRRQMPALQGRLDQLTAAMPDLKKGDVLSLTYVPDKGAVVGGAAKETVIAGKDFADALFSVWLGPDPVDGDLKRKLLGG